MLNNMEARNKFFGALAAHKDGDHGEVTKVKSKIQQLIDQELEELGFKQQLSEEEASGVAAETFNEVATKSNFYFQYDANKADKNLKIYDFKAPGNKHRHPNVILPHEHVNIQKWLDTSELTPEKLSEIYAYNQLLVDLHIAQIRPGNITTKTYVNPKYPAFTQIINDLPQSIDNKFFEAYHRFREPSQLELSLFEKFNAERESLPTTDHFDEKGTKYDIEWSEDMKFPHVATRLGFPELREEPLERILGWERAQASVGYQFQPFVQTPPLEPDEKLNFAEGEVIYENSRVGEWIKFWKASAFITMGLSPAFYLFELYAGDGAPSLQWMADTWNWFQIPLQFQDGGNWQVENVRYPDDHDYMNFHYTVKRAIIRPMHTAYIFNVLVLMYAMDFDYVTKMRYNQDKDLVFVTKPSRFWGEEEHVHELHHLEQMVPSPVTAMRNMMDPKGILTVHDMATKDYLKFYKEDKYWNVDLKEEFASETRGLWENTHADKYTGRIFQSRGELPLDYQLDMHKVDKEMEEAAAKHGDFKVHTSHIKDFYENINQKKKDITSY